MIDSKIKRRVGCTHLWWTTLDESSIQTNWASGWCIRFDPHFGLNALASAFVLFSVSPVLVLVPLSVLNSTYSWPSVVDLIVKSPNRSSLVPMCVAISRHRVCWSVRGSLLLSAPDDHVFYVGWFKCISCIWLVSLALCFWYMNGISRATIVYLLHIYNIYIYIYIYIAIPKVVSYIVKPRHCFTWKLFFKNVTKNMGCNKPDFTVISSMETYWCAYWKKALKLPEVAIRVRRLVDQLTNRPFCCCSLQNRVKWNQVNCIDYQ